MPADNSTAMALPTLLAAGLRLAATTHFADPDAVDGPLHPCVNPGCGCSGIFYTCFGGTAPRLALTVSLEEDEEAVAAALGPAPTAAQRQALARARQVAFEAFRTTAPSVRLVHVFAPADEEGEPREEEAALERVTAEFCPVDAHSHTAGRRIVAARRNNNNKKKTQKAPAAQEGTAAASFIPSGAVGGGSWRLLMRPKANTNEALARLVASFDLPAALGQQPAAHPDIALSGGFEVRTKPSEWVVLQGLPRSWKAAEVEALLMACGAPAGAMKELVFETNTSSAAAAAAAVGGAAGLDLSDDEEEEEEEVQPAVAPAAARSHCLIRLSSRAQARGVVQEFRSWFKACVLSNPTPASVVGRLPRLAHGGLVAVEVATAARTVSRQTAGPASLSAPILLSYLQSQNRAFRDDKTLSDVVVPFVGVAPVTLLQVRAAEDAAAVIRMLAEREAAVAPAPAPVAAAAVARPTPLSGMKRRCAPAHEEEDEDEDTHSEVSAGWTSDSDDGSSPIVMPVTMPVVLPTVAPVARASKRCRSDADVARPMLPEAPAAAAAGMELDDLPQTPRWLLDGNAAAGATVVEEEDEREDLDDVSQFLGLPELVGSPELLAPASSLWW